MRDTRNMTVKDIVLLALGAILGAVVGQWYGRATGGVARRMRAGALRRRSGEGVAGSLSAKIVAYYRKSGLESSLYSPRMVGAGEPIALLFAPDLDFPRSVGIDSDSLFSCDHSFTRFPVSNRILRWYRRRGVRLFDGEFMWVMDANILARKLTNVRVGRFNFYAYATLCFRLQREMASRWRTPKMHDRFLRTFDSALGSELRPQAVGCMVATLLQGDDGLYIAIAKRSTEVLNGPSTRSLLPVFGMECNAIGNRSSDYGLTFYNFVREFSEEFFDLEELVHMMSARRVDPDWIFQLPSAAAVLREARAGRLQLLRTGFGVNPNDGIFNCALVAHFSSSEFFKWLRTDGRLNWESASDATSSAPLEFVRLDDPRLDVWVDRQEIDPSSVFALDLARQYAADLAVPKASLSVPRGRRGSLHRPA